MIGPFEFATSGRVLFGRGKLSDLPAVAKTCGRNALVVCGRNPDRAEVALRLLVDAGVTAQTFSIPGEPEVSRVCDGAEAARRNRCDMVIGFGGGSAVDAAKAIAALATNTRDIFDYLEVIGKAKPLEAAPLPVIAVPTTAGTGAEATRNAVLSSKKHGVKASLRHVGMLPRVAIVDSDLTLDLPPALTASTGMDALTQLIEPFVSHRANAMTDALCRAAIPRVAVALPRVFANGQDADARSDMSLGSLYSGMALANAGLGAVHGFAAPIGGRYPAPHGAVCAALLPAVMRANIAAARAANNTTVLSRYEEIASMLTSVSGAPAEDGIAFIERLCGELRIPRLSDFSIPRADLPEIAARARESSSMKGNPIPLSHETLVSVLSESW